MRPDLLADVLSGICEASLNPEEWPRVLQGVAEYLGAEGAAYIMTNRHTARVEWISLAGPAVGRQHDYVNHFAALDPYMPLLAVGRGWLRLLACLPETRLRHDGWYNDFLLKSGVCDIIGTELCSSPSHSVVFGIHYGFQCRHAEARHSARLQAVTAPLREAASLHLRLNNQAWRSSVAGLAIDQLGAAVIVTDCDRRIVELNHAAERLLATGDGLTARQGKLGALRSFETAKLGVLISAAATPPAVGPTIGRMLVGSRDGGVPFAVSVAALGTGQSLSPRPPAMVLVAGADRHQPSAADLADLFGLSPAESRLAATLIQGMRLSDIALATGVRITTLRTQLSSILKKVGATRQADLVRILTSIPLMPRAIAKSAGGAQSPLREVAVDRNHGHRAFADR